MYKTITCFLIVLIGSLSSYAQDGLSRVFLVAETGGYEFSGDLLVSYNDKGQRELLRMGRLLLFVKYPESIRNTAIEITYEDSAGETMSPFIQERGTMLSFYIRTDILVLGSTYPFLGEGSLNELSVFDGKIPPEANRGITFVKGPPLPRNWLETEGMLGWPYDQYVECQGVVNSYDNGKPKSFYSPIERKTITKDFRVTNIGIQSPECMIGNYDFFIPTDEPNSHRGHNMSFDSSILMQKGARIKFYLPDGYINNMVERHLSLSAMDIEDCAVMPEPLQPTGQP